MGKIKIPKFLWGTATSAFQIEGGIKNDMTDWEDAGRFRTNGKNPLVGDAVDHWRRWERDFDLLREIGVNSYRFSVEWARIEPEPGRYDIKAVDQYSRMIDRLLEYNIVPMVTLHHFTHPSWFHERSPWIDSRSVESFVRFTEFLAPRFMDRVPFVVTFNEPLVWLLAGYGYGKFPPGENDPKRIMAALYNMLMAHREAYDCIKEHNPKCKIGIAHNFIAFKRAPKGIRFDRDIKRVIHHFYNQMIMEAFQTNRLKMVFPLVTAFDKPIPLDDKIDFWGVNYYYRLHVKFKFNFKQPFELLSIVRSSGQGKSDLGWEIYPKGLQKVCRWLAPYNKPIYITENGVAANDDGLRVEFLKSHLNVLEKVRKENKLVRGYFYWSLMDNYEWLEGTAARFGLYHTDYENDLGRSMKPSAEFYRDYIEAAPK